jgi:hypothetical protein
MNNVIFIQIGLLNSHIESHTLTESIFISLSHNTLVDAISIGRRFSINSNPFYK